MFAAHVRLLRRQYATWLRCPYCTVAAKISRLREGPGLEHFIHKSQPGINVGGTDVPYLAAESVAGQDRKVYFDVYGCQMNVSDAEIAWSILKSCGYDRTEDVHKADVVLVVTCSIREGAEQKVWNRLQNLKGLKKKRTLTRSRPPLKIGILGCMAERLKHRWLEKESAVDLVAGPDSYRDLPRLLSLTDSREAVNVQLSLDETYADVAPVRLESSLSAYVSIMRGCDNMCTYCIVPFVRGRERSRPADSIVEEVRRLSGEGIKEITLLGQNVNSYRDTSTSHPVTETHLSSPAFKTVYKPKHGGLRFASLLERVSEAAPETRIRFTSPHPKDFPPEVLQVMSDAPNICKQIHLPAQSGDDRILAAMRRGYTRDAYLELVRKIREVIPGVSLSSDFICGFCSETELEFEKTLCLIEEVGYNTAFLFAYSMREKTQAYHRLKDDVPEEEKRRRLDDMIRVFREKAEMVNRELVGSEQVVLVEGESKRSSHDLQGRNDGNVKVIFPKLEVPTGKVNPGDYVAVKITDANSQVLKGHAMCHTTLQGSSV